MAGYPVVIQPPSAMTLIPVVENTWIDISSYVGKLIQFVGGGLVEFSNDGVSPIPYILPMNLNPSTWYSGGNGGNEWSTNYPAKYIRFPSLAAYVGGAVTLYGSLTPIERKMFSIVAEESVGSLTASPTVIGEELDHDPFVQRITVDGDTNGIQTLLQLEYAGKRTAGNAWTMHSSLLLVGSGGTLQLPGTAGAADNAVIFTASQRLCCYFNRVSVYCTAGTIDVDIRPLQYGAWNAAVAMRRQSDNLLVTQLAAGEVGILENVSFETLQVLQKGAAASNAILIFSEPFRESVPFVDLGPYSGPIALWSYSSANGAAIYIHKHY